MQSLFQSRFKFAFFWYYVKYCIFRRSVTVILTLNFRQKKIKVFNGRIHIRAGYSFEFSECPTLRSRLQIVAYKSMTDFLWEWKGTNDHLTIKETEIRFLEYCPFTLVEDNVIIVAISTWNGVIVVALPVPMQNGSPRFACFPTIKKSRRFLSVIIPEEVSPESYVFQPITPLWNVHSLLSRCLKILHFSFTGHFIRAIFSMVNY